MKKIITSVLLFSIAFLATAQNTIVNDANAEQRTVGAFTGITVSSAIDIYLSQGDEDAIAVSATDIKYRDRIKTEVKAGILTIWYENEGMHWSSGSKKLKAYISFKNINRLKASGASDVFINGVLKLSDLDVRLSGASDLKGALDITNLTANISGASDMTVSGKIGFLNIEAHGASDLKDFELVVQNCDAIVSGASDIKITVEKELNGKASGASDIRIKGNGVIKTMNSSGASSIKKS
ncbi:MAG: head GIN domain-containing protein [Chitinophagaceae bacterium]